MIRLNVRVSPGARTENMQLRPDGTVEVRVRAVAHDGRANEALVELLCRRLGLRRRQVRIQRGAHSREKLIEVDVTNWQELERRLAAATTWE